MPEATPTRETSLAGKPIQYEIRRSVDAAEPRIDVDIRGVRVTLPRAQRRTRMNYYGRTRCGYSIRNRSTTDTGNWPRPFL